MVPVRRLLLYLHRYVGLTIAPFLVIVGLTGSLVVYFEPLDTWLNPELRRAVPDGQLSADPLAMREAAQARVGERGFIDYVPLGETARRSFALAVTPAIGRDGEPTTLSSDELFFDPATGAYLGGRRWSGFPTARRDLMPFIYRLHYELAQPRGWMNLGGIALGIVALVWSMDCFVGLWLTVPPRRRDNGSRARRWLDGFRISSPSRARLLFDLHRANGLWLWPLLFVLAWSGVGFNLPGIYGPAMDAALGHLPDTTSAPTSRALSADWQTALARGRHLMIAAGQREHFTVIDEDSIALDRATGRFTYSVRSSRDVGRLLTTSVSFDSGTGSSVRLSLPWQQGTRETSDRWLILLHMGGVGGAPYRLLLCFTGIGTASLSITGVLLWFRKRNSRMRRKQQRAVIG